MTALPVNITDAVAIAEVDITSAIFQLPTTVSDQMYAKVNPPNITNLTTGTVLGTGVFDIMMASVKAQLREEYECNRITGGEYAKAFIELTSAALQNAVQYSLTADTSFWQAQTAQVQAITGRIQMENARFTYQNTLPAQFAQIVEQGNQSRAQTSDTRLDGIPVAGVMGAQESLYKQQVTSYQRDAEVKAAKIFSDSWITQKTIDSGLLPPQAFTNDSVNNILACIMTNNGFTLAASTAAEAVATSADVV